MNSIPLQLKKKIIIVKEMIRKRGLPGRRKIGGRGEERDGSPIMFRSKLIFS